MRSAYLIGVFVGLSSVSCEKTRNEPATPSKQVNFLAPSPLESQDSPNRPTDNTVADLTTASHEYEMTAESFHKAFAQDKDDAASKYKGKVIKLTGEVAGFGRTESGDSHIYLKVDGDLIGVECHFAKGEPWTRAVPNQRVILKGKCIDGAELFHCVFLETGAYEAIKITATELAKEFADDPRTARKRYEDKYLIMSGEVEKIAFYDSGAAIVDLKALEMVHLRLSFTANEKKHTELIHRGEKIRVIGRCAFTNDDVLLIFCIPVKEM